MGRTPFYRTSNELEHHFLNIKRTQLCSSIGDWTRTPYFCFRMLEHETSNLIGLSIDLLYSWTHSNIIFSNVERTWTCSSIGNRFRTPYFWLQTIEHQTSNIVQPITTYSTSLINIKSFQNMHVETVFSVIDLFFTQKIKNVMFSIKT